MLENTFTFKGKNNSDIFYRKWTPENNEFKGILQIAHGMAEHSGRYREFGEFMTKNGYIVYINDHLGHGQTAKTIDNLGFFDKKDGWIKVVEDVHTLSLKIKQEHPDLKHFVLGHSMGSFIMRTFISKYHHIVSGAIISGTNGKSGALVNFGRIVAFKQGFLKGKRSPSKLLDNLSFGSYNNTFKPVKTKFDWLSRDDERNKDYCDDPFCGTVFSNRFFYDMLTMIGFVNSKKTINKVSKDLPIFIFSGSKDPVGNFGKEVEMVFNKYKNSGVKDIKLKLYDDGRHEMLNEINRKEVYNDILNWLEEHRK